MNMSKEEYHKRVNKMYSELRTDRVDADREEVIRCQRLYLAEDRYIPSCEREIERLNNIIKEVRGCVETAISEDYYDGEIYKIKKILDKENN